ncbi:MAG: hypothetical protein ACM3KE_17945 [Hyphomicrobiales bacterium]
MMTLEVKDADASPAPAHDTEWNNRRLCSDENCIGVIGPDGRCKECGKPFDGGVAVELPRPAPAPPIETASPASRPDEAAGPDEEWESRRLCSDENCIGVIGPDGRCKECGKPYAE